jgi:hypothetical protein
MLLIEITTTEAQPQPGSRETSSFFSFLFTFAYFIKFNSFNFISNLRFVKTPVTVTVTVARGLVARDVRQICAASLRASQAGSMNTVSPGRLLNTAVTFVRLVPYAPARVQWPGMLQRRAGMLAPSRAQVVGQDSRRVLTRTLGSLV